ncbi:MAG: nitroreductase [Gammaproteobacteria bacterium]|nr:nitroreductase [Gammaproteobacteria bacterium]
MHDITFLQQRHSTAAKQLGEPAPNKAELEQILAAAVAAPDHGGLQPWRFLIIEKEARQKLGDLMASCYQKRHPQATTEQVERQRIKPLRSPLIITVVAKIQSNPSVNKMEQILSAGAACQQILLASQALGYGAIWLSGESIFDWNINEGLELGFDDQIVGFLYLGTETETIAAPQRPSVTDFIQHWNPSSKS